MTVEKIHFIEAVIIMGVATLLLSTTRVTLRDRLEEPLVNLAQVFHELRATVPVPQGRV